MATIADILSDIKADLSLSGSTAYDAQIGRAIQSALRGFRGKKISFLRAIDTITLLTGNSSVALPSDLSTPDTFRLSYSNSWLDDENGFSFLEYDRFKRDYLQQTTLRSGVPSACGILGRTLYVDVVANTDYTIEATYWKQDAALPAIGSTETSVWFDDGYDAVYAQAKYLFKRNSEMFTASEEDGRLAREAFKMLNDQSNSYEAGGR